MGYLGVTGGDEEEGREKPEDWIWQPEPEAKERSDLCLSLSSGTLGTCSEE